MSTVIVASSSGAWPGRRSSPLNVTTASFASPVGRFVPSTSMRSPTSTSRGATSMTLSSSRRRVVGCAPEQPEPRRGEGDGEREDERREGAGRAREHGGPLIDRGPRKVEIATVAARRNRVAMRRAQRSSAARTEGEEVAGAVELVDADVELGLEDVPEAAVRHHLLDGALGHDSPAFQEGDAVGVAGGGVEVVEDGDAGRARAARARAGPARGRRWCGARRGGRPPRRGAGWAPPAPGRGRWRRASAPRPESSRDGAAGQLAQLARLDCAAHGGVVGARTPASRRPGAARGPSSPPRAPRSPSATSIGLGHDGHPAGDRPPIEAARVVAAEEDPRRSAAGARPRAAGPASTCPRRSGPSTAQSCPPSTRSDTS